MAEDGKRVEVRMGSFSCTIEGYDDPVDKLKEVMSLVQRMVSETPALVDVSAEVDNAEVQEALDTEPVRVRNTSEDGDQTTAREAPKDEPEAAPEPEQPKGKSETDGEFTLAAADAADRIRTPKAEDAAPPSPEPDPFKDVVAEDAAARAATETADAKVVDTPPAPDIADTARTDDTPAAPADPTPPPSTDTEDTTTEAPTTASAAPLRTPAADSTKSGRKLYGMGRFAASIAAGRNRKTARRDVDEPQADPQDTTEAAETPSDDFRIKPVVVPDPAPEDTALRVQPDTPDDDDLADLNDDVSVNIFASDLQYDAPTREEPVWGQDTSDTDTADATADHHDAGPASDEFADFDQDPQDNASAFAATDVFDTPDRPDPAPEAITDTDADTNLFRSPDLGTNDADAEVIPPESTNDQADGREPGKGSSGSKVGNVFRSLFGAKGRDTATEATPPEPEPERVSEKTVAEDAEEPFTNIFASDGDEAARSAPVVDNDLRPAPADDYDVTPTTTTAEFVEVHEPAADLRATEPEDAIVNIFANDADEAPLELRAERGPAPEAPRYVDTTEPPQPEQTDDGTPNRFGALLDRLQSERDEPATPLMAAPGETADAPSDASPEAAGVTAAELAELAGASSVSDLLAASAAWLTLTNGKLRFTRRDVMDVFDGLPGDHPKTLEARIKGYGKLVRSGTLVLIDDGQFALAQTERDRFSGLLS